MYHTISKDPWNPYPIRGNLHFNALQYGAVPDNSTLSTFAIQKAIDAAKSAVSSTSVAYVIIPKGTFRIGTINLTSNVYLVLMKGASLQASNNPAVIISFHNDH